MSPGASSQPPAPTIAFSSSSVRCSGGRGMDRCQRGTARARLDEQHLHIAELALLEAALAVAQIELPQPQEPFRIALRAYLGRPRQEALAPQTQGARIVRPDVLEVKQLEVGHTRQRIDERLHRGYEAAGKD